MSAFLYICLGVLLSRTSLISCNDSGDFLPDDLEGKSYIVNIPQSFHNRSSISEKLLDVSNDHNEINSFIKYVTDIKPRIHGATDGEILDTLEQFFWGKKNGLAIELGALDGSFADNSMTAGLEEHFGWHRILIEGNPDYRERMKTKSPLAFSVNAAICEKHQYVHFQNAAEVGGIIEFMPVEMLKRFHGSYYESTHPPGNISSIDWSKHNGAKLVRCLPLKHILKKAGVRHVNLFILDVEGGEMNVLKSIDWHLVKFDVIAVETDIYFRPPGYGDAITEYLRRKGYRNATGQMGRNIWFTHPTFIPSRRPDLVPPDCFRGAGKSVSLGYSVQCRLKD